MFQDVVMMLSRMGLKDKDGTVYLVCLHFKDGLFVHEIVKETKLKRSTIDVILDRLIDQGFMNKVKVGNRFKYIAQSPEAILFKQEEVLEDFRTILPMLSKLGAEKGETEIRFFEGKKGLKQIYDDILLKLKFAEGDGRQLIGFTSGIDVMKVFPNIQKNFIDKRIKIGVPYKSIVPTTSKNVKQYITDASELRAIKNIDSKKFPFKSTFEIYADSVMIYSPHKPFGGVVIRNEKIADSMRALFYLVWNLLPDDNQGR